MRAFLGLLIVAWAGISGLVGQVAVAPNEPAPPLVAYDLDGRKVRFDWSESRFTIVNFWATWCEPCRVEMPRLQELATRYAGALGVVGVVRDDEVGAPAVALHAARLGVTYPLLLGGKRVSTVWGGVGILPTTFLVDAEGRVRGRYVGGNDETWERLLADVTGYLGQPPPAPEAEALTAEGPPGT